MLIHHPNIVKSGLIAYYDFGNPKSYPVTGTRLNDLTKNKITATLVNSPTYNNVYGGGLTFDGVSGYIDLTSSTIGTLSDFSNGFTIDIWYKFNTVSSSGYDMIFSANNISYNTNRHGTHICRFGTTDQLAIITYTNPLVDFSMDGNIMPSLSASTGIIQNFSCTIPKYPVGNVTHAEKIYMNGISQSITQVPLTSGYTTTYSMNLPRNYDGNVYLGKSSSVYLPSTNGNVTIYSLKIYNRGLSTTEISQNYNATKARFGL